MSFLSGCRTPKKISSVGQRVRETPPEQLHTPGTSSTQRGNAEKCHRREDSFAGESRFHGSPKAGGSVEARTERPNI